MSKKIKKAVKPVEKKPEAPAKKRIRKPLTPEQRKRKQERDRAYKARKALEKAVKAPAKKVAAKKPVKASKPSKKSAKKVVGVVKVPAKKAAKRVRKPLTAEQRSRKNAKARQTYAARHGRKVSCAGKCCGKKCGKSVTCGAKSIAVTNKAPTDTKTVTVRPATRAEVEKVFSEMAESVAEAITEMFGSFMPVVVKAQAPVSPCDRLTRIAREISDLVDGRKLA